VYPPPSRGRQCNHLIFQKKCQIHPGACPRTARRMLCIIMTAKPREVDLLQRETRGVACLHLLEAQGDWEGHREVGSVRRSDSVSRALCCSSASHSGKISGPYGRTSRRPTRRFGRLASPCLRSAGSPVKDLVLLGTVRPWATAVWPWSSRGSSHRKLPRVAVRCSHGHRGRVRLL